MTNSSAGSGREVKSLAPFLIALLLGDVVGMVALSGLSPLWFSVFSLLIVMSLLIMIHVRLGILNFGKPVVDHPRRSR